MDTVWLDNPVRKYNVEIVNTGRESLTINEVRPDCDCTTVSYSKEPIPSGEKGKVTITIDLHGFLPDSVHKKIGIYTNATDTPQVITLDGVAWRHV